MPPLWMFVVGSMAATVVITVGVLVYKEHKRSQRVKVMTKSPHSPSNSKCETCENKASIKCRPCGHTFCRFCADEFFIEDHNYTTRCPVVECRLPIEDIDRLHPKKQQ